ncbi:MAG: hypothetical protein ABI612_21440, partial [Betaproteobacteria bacterium]
QVVRLLVESTTESILGSGLRYCVCLNCQTQASAARIGHAMRASCRQFIARPHIDRIRDMLGAARGLFLENQQSPSHALRYMATP